jgi:hypothetical protein
LYREATLCERIVALAFVDHARVVRQVATGEKLA